MQGQTHNNYEGKNREASFESTYQRGKVSKITMEIEEPRYESWAEEQFYPYLWEVAKELKMDFKYQYEITEEVPNRCYSKFCPQDEDYGQDEYDGDIKFKRKWKTVDSPCDDFDDCEWFKEGYNYTKYRLDFLLTNKKLKVDIEVDGKKWHNKEKDSIRDKYMNDRGYCVIRVAAAEIHRNPLHVAIRVKNDVLMMVWESENGQITQEALK